MVNGKMVFSRIYRIIVTVVIIDNQSICALLLDKFCLKSLGVGKYITYLISAVQQ